MTAEGHGRVLVVLRHAKSSWDGDEPDHDRPLAARGLRQAGETGAWLAGRVAPPDVSLVSSAARARATYDAVARAWPGVPAPTIDAALYAAPGGSVLDVVRRRGRGDTVLVVGHNPGLEDLVGLLGEEEVVMRTSAVAVLGVQAPWSALAPGGATLRAGRRLG